MMKHHRMRTLAAAIVLWLIAGPRAALPANVPIGGFNSLVGMALSNQFKDELEDTFFLADTAQSPPLASLLGSGFFELAILDSGAAAHILTPQAHNSFNIDGAGFGGTEFQQIGGATGILFAEISDPLGVYAAGLSNRTMDEPLKMPTAALRGQTSVAVLSAPSEWTLPSLVGMPLVSQYATIIRNDQPQIFQHDERTVRSPNVEFDELGSGGHGITRRTTLKLRPGTSFLQPPLYVFNTNNILEFLPLTEDPLSPTVVENGGFFIDVDLAHESKSLIDLELFFDTGFDVTVLSPITAARLGHDIATEEPDFVVQAEGPGGLATNIPGFYLDELTIPAVGGFFTATNVPVLVLEVPNVSDPGNVVDGVVGMNLFVGRNLVIDPNPAIGQGGVGPSLYIGDLETEAHQWSTAAASGNWTTEGNWTAPGTPDVMWVAEVANGSGTPQEAVISANSTVNRVKISGTAGGTMTVRIDGGASLTVFGDVQIGEHGRLRLSGGRLDTQLVQIEGGTLTGSGEVFIGNGPVINAVQNISGTIAPGDAVGLLSIDGDLSASPGATLAIELGGTTAVSQYDQLDVSRFAFLGGTLAVTLVDLGGGTFAPSMGDEFTILTAGEEVLGEFAQFMLPGGYQWGIVYNEFNVVLTVVDVGGLLGDFNGDDMVDAADYTVWRNNYGTSFDLNGNGDETGGSAGTVDLADYDMWKANYGMGAGAGGVITSYASAGAPEPGAAALAFIAALLAGAGYRPNAPLARSREPAATRLARSAASIQHGSSVRP
jgi:hypothetical protein